MPGPSELRRVSSVLSSIAESATLAVDAKAKALKVDWEDEIVKAMALTRDGKVVNPALGGQG